MSINGEDILYSWYCDSDCDGKSERDFSELETAAKNGDEEAIENLYALKAEAAIDVEQNISALEKLCKNGSRRAARNLGILYQEGIAKRGKNHENTVIIPQNLRKSEKYLSMAAEQKDLLALFTLCMQLWLRCHLASDDEEYRELYPDTCPEGFLAAEKWLLKFYSLKDDESLCEEEKDYIQKQLSIVTGWIASLYEKQYPTSPLHNPEKAAEWGVKAREYER